MSTEAKLSESYVVLGLKDRIGYGLGDLASNLSYGLVSFFLLFFYTDFYGLSAVQASLIFVIARGVDAIFNLILGVVIDKTHSKYGKLRPWLLYGSIPLGFLTVSCFITVDSELKFYYALISYTVYCLAYTAVNTPYSALTNRLTQHEGSRSSLSAWRFILAVVGMLIVSTFAEPLVSLFDNAKTGYIFAASLFSMLATVFFLVCFVMTKERVADAEVTEKPNFGDMLRSIATNPPLLNLSLFTVFIYIATTIWFQTGIYYANYYLEMPGFIGTFFMVYSLCFMAGSYIYELLVPKTGKKTLVIGMLVLGMLGLLMQHYIASDNIWLIMIGVGIFSLACAAPSVAMWAMVADTVEYSELKNGIRTEGAIYGFFNFITKIAMAIGGGMGGWLLNYFSYDAEQINTRAVEGINIMMTIIPCLLFAASIIPLLFYSLNERRYREIVSKLSLRSAKREINAAD